MDPVAGIVACFIAPGLWQRNTLQHSTVSAQAASVGDELGRPAGVRCAVVRPRHTAPAPTPLVEGSAADRVQTSCPRVQVCTGWPTSNPDNVFALLRNRLNGRWPSFLVAGPRMRIECSATLHHSRF